MNPHLLKLPRDPLADNWAGLVGWCMGRLKRIWGYMAHGPWVLPNGEQLWCSLEIQQKAEWQPLILFQWMDPPAIHSSNVTNSKYGPLKKILKTRAFKDAYTASQLWRPPRLEEPGCPWSWVSAGQTCACIWICMYLFVSNFNLYLKFVFVLEFGSMKCSVDICARPRTGSGRLLPAWLPRLLPSRPKL